MTNLHLLFFLNITKKIITFEKSNLLKILIVTFLIELLLININLTLLIKLFMGIFWDLIQQNEIQEQSKKADNLEERVSQLEKELADTKIILNKTLTALENYLEKDIDGDGITGN